ncbi:MAG TPA: hypothetical protein VKH40_01600 [Alloacidobacterium sp.]|nr:hypothetical protein [Alloacidobacterium sp.]
MHKRAVVVAIMVLFLVTGIISSTACEMMCPPSNQAAVCCAHPMPQCTNGASVISAKQCTHSQEETAWAATVTQSSQLQVTPGTIPLTLPSPVVTATAQDGSLRVSVNRSSFVPPLRI